MESPLAIHAFFGASDSLATPYQPTLTHTERLGVAVTLGWCWVRTSVVAQDSLGFTDSFQKHSGAAARLGVGRLLPNTF